ncbi:MAG: hypothetical protein CL824_06005 [Crocinitomicaceae bacterium]|nr:hypothetical protein [Crocinitomicaceae bacterium]
MKIFFSLIFIIPSFLNAQTFTNYTVNDGLIDNSVNCISIDGNNNVWIGTQNGISKFDGTTWTSYTNAIDSGIVNNTINAICALSNGNIWIGTDFGASLYDGNTWTPYTTSNGLGDDRINHIAEKSDGSIWFSDYDGITIYDGSTWTSYTMNDGLPFGGINQTDFDSNGDAWLASGLGGLIKFDGSTFETYNQSNGLVNNKIRSILVDTQDNKWAGTAEGLSEFNSGNVLTKNHTIMLTLPPPDTLNPVEDLAMDSQGNIWSGIYVDYLVTEGGIAVYNGSFWADFDVSDGLVGPVVRSIDVDGNDNVWVGTSTGISKIENTPVSLFENEDIKFNIHPNPNNGLFQIESTKQINDATIMIKNIEGKQIANINSNINHQFYFEITGDSGLYFIEVIASGAKIFNAKIVKK